MNKKHTTKNGEVMFISQMTTTHLIATVNELLRTFREAKKHNSMDNVLYVISAKEVRDKEKGILNGSVDKLAPYLMECMLRGISFTKDLQELYVRTDQLGNADVKELIPFDCELPYE